MRFFLFPKFRFAGAGVSLGPEDFRRLSSSSAASLTAAPPGSFVYVIKGQHGRSKIGITNNPTARMAQLRTASAYPISFAFLGAAEDASGALIEGEAHRILDRFRANGEWFDCAPELAIAAVNAAAATVGKGLCNIDPAVADQVLQLVKNGSADIKPRRQWGAAAWMTLVLVGTQWFMMKALDIHDTRNAISLSIGIFIPYLAFVSYMLGVKGRYILTAIFALVVGLPLGLIIALIIQTTLL